MKPTLFLDCDETILYSRSHIVRAGSAYKDGETGGSIPFMYKDDVKPSCTLARPSAKMFLDTVKDKYHIRMITQGWVSFQQAALKAAGLLEYFEDIYGYADDGIDPTIVERIKLPEKWALVDNDPFPYVKARWLGVDDGWNGRLINCSAWMGHGEQSLMDLLPAIEKVLG